MANRKKENLSGRGSGRSKNDLTTYLITRLILITIGCILAELILMALLRISLFPLIAAAAGNPGSDTLPGVRELIMFLWYALHGNAQLNLIGISGRSVLFLLSLLCLLILLLPVIFGVLLYARLVSEWVETLEKEREEERAAFDRRRNLMLSDFAHDLRTPIMTISGYAGALADGMVPDEAEQQEYLQAIRRKADRLAEQISQLFAFVRLGSDGFSLNLEDTDLHEILRETAADFYTDIEDAGMDLTIEIPDEPWMISADKALLKRMVQNLLLNAVKHNAPGTGILLAIRQSGGTEMFIVADTGGRIEKDPRELFEPFVRGDSARGSDGGSGLGLSFVKQAAIAHGWAVALIQPFEDYTKAFAIRCRRKI